MKLFVIRLLYSLYCAERWNYRVTMRVLDPFINRLCKLLYSWNPFGFVQKNNPTLERYIENVHRSNRIVFYDYVIGAQAEGILVSSFVPCEMLIFSVIRKLRILPIQYSHFSIYLIISCVISLVFTHFFGLKNDEYIGYFHKFEQHKNNAVWHIVSSVFFIGAVCAGIFCIILWNES